MNLDKVAILYRGLLYEIEGNDLRSDLVETPMRAARGLAEMLDGYQADIPALFKAFDGEGQDQIVAAKDIICWSLCEHHLIPVSLNIDIAYLPRKRVIGASKLERLAHAFAHRLQLQERIARQIAESIMQNLDPLGVAVIIEGVHGCIRCRGVKSQSSSIVNSVMLGAFRKDPTARLEVLSLLGGR